MKGSFRKSAPSLLFFIVFCIVSGTFIAAKFTLWGLNAAKSGQIAAAVFCFAFVAGGLLFGCFSIVLFNFNRKAYFIADNEKIDAEFGFGSSIHTKISNVRLAETANKNLRILTDDKTYTITGLINAKDVCEYLTERIMPSDCNVEECKSLYEKSKKRYVFQLVFVIAFVVLLFVNIGWCVVLTKGKDITEMSGSSGFVFIAFAAAELITLILAFFFAGKCGKQLSALNYYKKELISCAAKENKEKALDKYNDITEIKWFDRYRYRVVIFSVDDVSAYMLERYDLDSASWLPCYERAKGFEFVSDMYEELEETFSDVVWDK